MIREAGPKEEATVLRLARSQPATGPLVEIHWHIRAANPLVPLRFFLVGRQAVLKTTGVHATLCGTAEDPEELAAFLSFSGIQLLSALDQKPAGWQTGTQTVLLLRPGSPYLAGEENCFTASPGTAAFFRPPQGVSLDTCPAAREVFALLQQADPQLQQAQAADGFYADLNTRRNHGLAAVYGLRTAQGTLAATAGVYALTPREGYIACVETHQDCRRKGYASLLLRQLIASFGERPLSLLCAPNLAGFYANFGFKKTNRTGIISAPETPEAGEQPI